MMEFKILYSVHTNGCPDDECAEYVDCENWDALAKWCQNLEESGFSTWYAVKSIERTK